MVMNIRVLTPDRVICSTTADEVVLPGLTGQVGVLDGHAALITALDTGLLRIKLDEKWTPIIWDITGPEESKILTPLGYGELTGD